MRHALRLLQSLYVRIRRADPVEPGDCQRQFPIAPCARFLRPTARTDPNDVMAAAPAHLEKQTAGAAQGNSHRSHKCQGNTPVALRGSGRDLVKPMAAPAGPLADARL